MDDLLTNAATANRISSEAHAALVAGDTYRALTLLEQLQAVSLSWACERTIRIRTLPHATVWRSRWFPSILAAVEAAARAGCGPDDAEFQTVTGRRVTPDADAWASAHAESE